MFFEDPIRTVSVELPPGWAYHPFDSTLTDLFFIRWDRPDDLIAVHVRPASIAQEEPHEKWVEKIRSEVGDQASLTDLISNTSRAVCAEFKSGEGMALRVAFVRGPRVELVIEQRCMEWEMQDLWAPLERAVRTAVSSVNLKAPVEVGATELNHSIESANQAFEKKQYDAVVDALNHAIQVGTSAWLYSLAPPVNAPEINAAVRVAQAMMHLAGFSGAPSLQRNAELVLRRAQRTLEEAGSASESAQPLLAEISAALESLLSEPLKGGDRNAEGTLSPILAMRERGFRFANAAASAFEAGDRDNAYGFSGLAVDDLLSLIALLRRSQAQDVPAELAEHLAGQGIKDPAAQRDTIQKAREAMLFPPLNLCLQIRYCCALERPDADPSDATDILAPLAELLSDLNPGDIGTTLNLVLAMINCVGALALRSGSGYLEPAEQCLEKAVRLLNYVGDQHCTVDGWTRYHDRQSEATLRAIDRGLEKAGENKESLQSLRSQIEKIAGQIRGVLEPSGA
jgi:hypothetical protein